MTTTEELLAAALAPATARWHHAHAVRRLRPARRIVSDYVPRHASDEDPEDEAGFGETPELAPEPQTEPERASA